MHHFFSDNTHTTVLRACALYAASCSGMSLGELKWFQWLYRPAREGRSCEHFGGYKTINRKPLNAVIIHDHNGRLNRYLKQYISQCKRDVLYLRNTIQNLHRPVNTESSNIGN